MTPRLVYAAPEERAALMASDFHDVPASWFGAIIAVLSAALGAFGLWLANRMLGKAAFQTAINVGFKNLTDQLQEERKALLAQIDAERLQAAGERASLRGEIINLTQTIESLKELLRRNGIVVPRGHMLDDAALIVLSNGGEHG